MANIYRPPCDEGVARGAPAPAPCERRVGLWVLAASILGSSLTFIDGTAVNVALPALQAALSADLADAQWVVESYALTLSALLLAGGALGDRWGHGRIFAWGVAAFAVASVACGLAPDVRVLIAARGAQGAGAALLVPASLALLRTTFGPDERGRAIGTWAGFTAITAAAGPVLGGWLTDAVSWRAIFFLNVPLAAVVIAILLARAPADAPPDPEAPLDWPGTVLATLGLGGLVFGLVEWPRLGGSHPAVLSALAAGLALLVAFGIVQARSPHPMLPLDLFRIPMFGGANLLTLLLYAALGGALFFFPFVLVQVHGYSATEAGLALLPFVLLVFFLSRWSGGLLDRYGPRPPLVAGPLLAALGFALFAAPGVGGRYWTTFFPAVVVLGLGMAVSIAPLTTVVMSAVGARQAGLASGVNNAVSRVAGLVAVAAFGIVLSLAFERGLSTRLAELALPPDVPERIRASANRLGALEPPPGLGAQGAAAVRTAVAHAFVGGFRLVMTLAAALAAAAALTAALTLGRPAGAAETAAAAARKAA